MEDDRWIIAYMSNVDNGGLWWWKIREKR